jgi:putative phage-type endonuclease
MSITAEPAYKVLAAQPDTQEWLRIRKGGLGASEAAAILGLSKWATPLSVYMDKMSDSIDDRMSDRQDWGHRLEEPIAQWVRDTKHLNVTGSPGLIQSLEYPWLIATPDRQVDGCPLEIKSSDAFMVGTWDNGIPLNYQIQVQQQMLIMGAPHGYVAVLHGGNTPAFYEVARDDEFLEILVRRTQEFWADHIMAQVAPEPISTSETALAYPGEPDTKVEGSEALYELYGAYGLMQAEAVAVNQQLDDIKLKLQLAMKDATELTYRGETLFTWKPRAGAPKLDDKKLAEDHPELVQKYMRPGKHTRTFLRKKPKDD